MQPKVATEGCGAVKAVIVLHKTSGVEQKCDAEYDTGLEAESYTEKYLELWRRKLHSSWIQKVHKNFDA